MLVKPSKKTEGATTVPSVDDADRCHWNWGKFGEERCPKQGYSSVAWDNGQVGKFCDEHFARAEEQRPATAAEVRAAFGKIRGKLAGTPVMGDKGSNSEKEED